MKNTIDRSGGRLAARRAVARWAARLFRRDWRQQILIIALLTFTVAVAVFSIAAAYNVIPSRDGEFGSANHRIRAPAAAVTSLPELVASLESWFGPVEVVGHREARVPGVSAHVELRAQDTDGRYSRPMLRLRDGRYPQATSEVAVTDGVAELLGVGAGANAELDGRQLTVVGIVENPAKLNDEFALVPDSEATNADAFTILVSATRERAVGLPASIRVESIEPRPACHATLICISSGQSEQATGAAAVLGLATLLLLLVALVAVAGFVVVAQRRLRQLGMFIANGATDRHLRLVMLTNGALVGSIAAVAGGVIGTASWIVVAPLLEPAAGHRVDRLHLPMWLIAAALVIVVFTAVGASWKPARTVASVSVMTALEARPPRAKPARRSAIIAFALMAVGIGALSQAIDSAADHVNPLLLICGIVALIVGVVFLSPSVLGGLGRLASHVPIAPRIALRDLARYRARASAALAAISLALAIPVAVIVVASAAEHNAGQGNLSDRQLIIRIGDDPLLIPQRAPAEIDRLRAAVDALAGPLGADVTPLDVAIDPDGSTTRGAAAQDRAVVLGRSVDENSTRDLGVLYVATPLIVDRLGLPREIDALVDVLTPHAGNLDFANTSTRPGPPSTRIIDAPAYSSMPTSLITQTGLQRHGWMQAPAGWLVESGKPITSAERRSIRDTARNAGLTAEFRDRQSALGVVRTAATAVGLLVALGVLTLTLGLLRAESANELRTLTAAGAPRRLRRALSAATGGSLAIAGVVLGTFAAYAGLAAGYADSLSKLRRVPVLHLGLMLLGVPAIAGIGSWLLAGREPSSLRQSPLE